MAALGNIVRVLSATIGTGTLTLGSAVSGFLTFANGGILDGQTVSYAIEADYVTVGDDLVPTSREVGTGVYTASGTTLTRNVLNSTNGNALLSLAGDAQVIITPLDADIRDKLTADRTYFVRTDGNDANSGLANTAGGAFLTIAGAMAYIANNIDGGGFNVTLSIQNTSWTAQVQVLPNFVGVAILIFDFNGGSLTVTGQGTGAFYGGPYAIKTTIQLQNVTLSTVTSGSCINWDTPGALLLIGAGVTFGASANHHVNVGLKAIVRWSGQPNYTISGNAACHLVAQYSAEIEWFPGTVTLTGRTFSQAFVFAGDVATVQALAVGFTGTFTGTRYNVVNNAVVNTFGSGVNYFPGSVAGTTSTGGVYG